jgi:hypothetical protein
MNRRDFLKAGAVFSAAVLVPLNVAGSLAGSPAEVRYADQLYRGTSDGEIYVSEDEGQTWKLHTSFGADLSVLHLWVNFWGQLQARLGIAGHSFDLSLAKDGRIWRTMTLVGGPS